MSALPPSLARQPDLDLWIRIDADGTVTLFTGKVELGQGLRTAIARIGAEELDVSLERIRVATADTARGPNELLTVGSQSMEQSGTADAPGRGRGARAICSSSRRRELERPAGRSSRSRTAPSSSRGERPAHRRTGSCSAAAIRVRRHGRRRAEAARRAPHRRPAGARDRPAGLVTGTSALRPGPRRPGDAPRARGAPAEPAVRAWPRSTTQRCARCPAWSRSCATEASSRVVAEREEQAVRALDALAQRARWDETATLPPADDLAAWLRRAAGAELPGRRRRAADAPDPAVATPAAGGETLAATYTRPYQHARLDRPVGGAGGVARRRAHASGRTARASSSVLRAALARGARHRVATRCRVIHVEGPGCYGHNGADDVASTRRCSRARVPGTAGAPASGRARTSTRGSRTARAMVVDLAGEPRRGRAR